MPDLRPPHRGRLRRRPLHGPGQEDAAGVRRIGALSGDRPPLAVRRLGRVRYADGIELQQRLVRQRQAGEIGDVLLLLEHEPVFTLGRNARAGNVLFPAQQLRQRGFDVHEVGRGGDVTYHGPGQVVGYPIVELGPGRRDVHRYVRDLEEVMIRTCAAYGVAAGRIAGLTGCWVGEEKIGAIGVRISRWVTSHGFAFNVTREPLDAFRLIVPCGIRDKGVTALELVCGRPVDIEGVMDRLAENVAAVLSRALRPDSLPASENR
ncbi:MAG TPA: lipoyl(octanoyl) transferase LipB, partial [Vicinamibacteria bacterium]|nr:lipoyl(octanoyl) transferase LipB [Vicinamibacteria bacterium]